MAIYRPVKKIIIPLFGLMIGVAIAYFLMPTKMDVIYKEWSKSTLAWEEEAYSIESSYKKNDKSASTATGIWRNEESYYALAANVSDDSVFTFDFYIEGEKVFIHSGVEWRQATVNDRFINEIVPLDQPFEWMRDMLVHAERIEKNIDDEKEVYNAYFEKFDEVDFRGYSLEKQEETVMTITVKDEDIVHLSFHALPIRPEHVGRFDDYPEELLYELSFRKTDEKAPELPQEAYSSKGLDE